MRACGTKSELTDRCLRLTLTARTASDEILLTEIVNLMEDGSESSSIVILRDGIVAMEWSVEGGDGDEIQSAPDR